MTMIHAVSQSRTLSLSSQKAAKICETWQSFSYIVDRYAFAPRTTFTLSTVRSHDVDAVGVEQREKAIDRHLHHLVPQLGARLRWVEVSIFLQFFLFN